jgi:protein-S-isoprenylcysteine O-methyltransferase Ste14
MTDTAVQLWLSAAWITFLIYWIIKAGKTRETQRKESWESRYGVTLVLIAGYILIFNRHTRIGPLRWRFVPDAPSVLILGVVVTWLGVALAIWARHHLAENWSSRVTIKQGHELIRTGPYARLRHPIYTGLLLATIGSAIAVGEWRCVVGVCLVLAAYSFKAKREEAMLTQQFGEKFQEHRKHTGFLLPRWR